VVAEQARGSRRAHRLSVDGDALQRVSKVAGVSMAALLWATRPSAIIRSISRREAMSGAGEQLGDALGAVVRGLAGAGRGSGTKGGGPLGQPDEICAQTRVGSGHGRAAARLRDADQKQSAQGAS
jgi:hypothetical protein